MILSLPTQKKNYGTSKILSIHLFVTLYSLRIPKKRITFNLFSQNLTSSSVCGFSILAVTRDSSFCYLCDDKDIELLFCIICDKVFHAYFICSNFSSARECCKTLVNFDNIVSNYTEQSKISTHGLVTNEMTDIAEHNVEHMEDLGQIDENLNSLTNVSTQQNSPYREHHKLKNIELPSIGNADFHVTQALNVLKDAFVENLNILNTNIIESRSDIKAEIRNEIKNIKSLIFNNLHKIKTLQNSISHFTSENDKLQKSLVNLEQRLSSVELSKNNGKFNNTLNDNIILEINNRI